MKYIMVLDSIKLKIFSWYDDLNLEKKAYKLTSYILFSLFEPFFGHPLKLGECTLRPLEKRFLEPGIRSKSKILIFSLLLLVVLCFQPV